jgi:TonB family protein
VLCAAASVVSAQPRVYVENGNVMMERSAGEAIELTRSGRDFSPWMACDGRSVLFARSAPGDLFRTAIYSVDVPSKLEAAVFAGKLAQGGEDAEYLGQPELSASGTTLYVIANYSMTTGGLFGIDLKTRKAKYIAEAASYGVIRIGELAGDLLVRQRKRSVGGGVFYVYWLFSAEGEDLGIAGPGTLDEAALTSCGAGTRVKQGKESGSAPNRSTAEVHGERLSIHRIAKEVLASRLAYRSAPQYPDTARTSRIEGIVELLVRVSALGDVVDVKLVSGHPALVGAAIAAVRNWKYSPVLFEGEPGLMAGLVDVPFSLKSDAGAGK